MSDRQELERRYPDAPPSAYLTDEGWLVVGGEAWTEREWRMRLSMGYTPRKRKRPTQQTA